MKKQLRALGDFWREEYGRWVGMTAIAFLVLVVLSYIAGRLFPEISATILTYFNEVVADSGIVRDDGSFSALALFGNNLRAMVLSTLYGFIPFLYLPALSMGVNAILLGMVASSVNGQWLLLAAGILPHGIFELPALILSCALGLLICRTGTEKLRKRSDVSFLRRVLDCNRVFLSFVAPLLLVAALVEAYITPALLKLVM